MHRLLKLPEGPFKNSMRHQFRSLSAAPSSTRRRWAPSVNGLHTKLGAADTSLSYGLGTPSPPSGRPRDEASRQAQAEGKTTDEITRDALTAYLALRQLDRFQEYGQQRANELGLTEADIPRLIEESRRESRQ
jgi:hypothetical protein